MQYAVKWTLYQVNQKYAAVFHMGLTLVLCYSTCVDDDLIMCLRATEAIAFAGNINVFDRRQTSASHSHSLTINRGRGKE